MEKVFTENDIHDLLENDIDSVMELFCDCFRDDPYYKEQLGIKNRDEMDQAFRDSIRSCIKLGHCFGIKNDDQKVIAFIICFDYLSLRQDHPELFRKIFCSTKNDSSSPEEETELVRLVNGIIDGEKDKKEASPSRFLYGLSIGVHENFRKKKLASLLFDHVLCTCAKQDWFICDVSSVVSKEMCTGRGFKYEEIPLGQNCPEEYGLCYKKLSPEDFLRADVFVSVPVQYETRKKICEKNESDALEKIHISDILKRMDHHTAYEAGIASWETNDEVSYNDQAGLKNRIERYYLGTVEIQIRKGQQFEENKKEEIIGREKIGLYVSVDNKSKCGVLTWVTMNSRLLLSQYLDNIIRNSIKVIEGEGGNIYDYVKGKYGIEKTGSPKVFVMIPEEEDFFDENQTASLLAAEEIFDEGESFGRVNDEKITQQFKKRDTGGLGQYDRGVVYAFTNVLLHFLPEMKNMITAERIKEETATLFYMEMTQFEEAAIGIANRGISNLLGNTNEEDLDPILFLEEVDTIQTEFSKTIAFWNMQVNYPTSQLSIDMIRESFKIPEKRETLKRNQEQLQLMYGTKNDKNDRESNHRMNRALSYISLLAIFSALVDGNTLGHGLSSSASMIDRLQSNIPRLFVIGVILIIAAIAIKNIVLDPFILRIKKMRQRNKKKEQDSRTNPANKGGIR